ncbi:hypothetical protein QMP25_41245 (plasmid) [Enterocloster clostridioformis]
MTGRRDMIIEKKKMDGFLGVPIVAKEKDSTYEDRSEKTLNFYENYLKSGELLTEITFSQGNRQGLYFYRDKVQVILPRSELQDNLRYDFESIEYMRRKYTVKVVGVDRIGKVVTLSFKQAQEQARPTVVRAIKDSLAAGVPYRTLARIQYITRAEKGVCHVDLLGIGLHGIIPVREWSVAFTADIRMLAQIGDIVEVIVKEIVRGKEGEELYICSRKDALNVDPWEGIEEKAPKDTTVIVKCLRKYDNHFIGSIEGLEELSCYCHYPIPNTVNSHTGQTLVINTGGKYNGYISKVDEERHILRARILDEVAPGIVDEPAPAQVIEEKPEEGANTNEKE